MIDDMIGTGGRLYADAEPSEFAEPDLDISQLWSPPAPEVAPKPAKRRFRNPLRRSTNFWSNLSELAGISSISAGFGLISPSAGLISAGVGLLVIGVASGRPQ